MDGNAGEEVPAASICHAHDESQGDELWEVPDAQVAGSEEDRGDPGCSGEGHVAGERREQEPTEDGLFQDRC